MLSHRPRAVGAVEFHAQPRVHVQIGQQCAGGDDQGGAVLLRFHAAFDLVGRGADRRGLERVSGVVWHDGRQSDDGISLRQIFRFPRHDQYQQESAASHDVGARIVTCSVT